MNEQLYLISQILNILCKDFTDPHSTFGANVGKCRYCGTIGKLRYPDIVFEHAGDCVVSLNKSLQSLLERQEEVQQEKQERDKANANDCFL